MEKAERDRIMRQQVVLPETPVDRRELASLAEDLKSIPIAGRPLALRQRNFHSSPEAYLASSGGPLPYMLRLREIEERKSAASAVLAEAWRMVADACAGDPGRFERTWTRFADTWSFDEVNDLIDRHNRWYPVESRLAMNPRTGDYVLVNGRDYRVRPLDADWVLERLPAALARVATDA